MADGGRRIGKQDPLMLLKQTATAATVQTLSKKDRSNQPRANSHVYLSWRWVSHRVDSGVTFQMFVPVAGRSKIYFAPTPGDPSSHMRTHKTPTTPKKRKVAEG